MKDFKGSFDTVQDIYEAFLNGGESGWFALAGGVFYEWVDEAWITITYSPITTWEIPIGNWLSVNVANPPIGLSVGTYQIISYKDYLNQVQTYCFGVWLYKIDNGIATRVNGYKKTYTENEYTQPTASQIQDIPLLKYQKEKVETIEELYLRYPNGGEDGWYAMVTDLNSFAYWEKDTEEWREMGGESDLSLFEKTLNKVIEWSDEPSDTNYPSEKLVKDSLDGLQDNIDNLDGSKWEDVGSTHIKPKLNKRISSDIIDGLSTTTIIEETPLGAINGINTTFTLAYGPISKDAVFVSVNGINREDFSITNKIITLDFAPSTGSSVSVTYFKSVDVLNIKVGDIADLQVPKVTLSVFKNGMNGLSSPQIFKWTQDLTISNVLLMSNCSGLSVKINGVTYNSNTMIGITILAGVELEVVDIPIVAGKDNANAIIIF
jgi:hypothetical protein